MGKTIWEMLELIESQNLDGLLFFCAVRVSIVLLCWLFMVISNMVDFWSGITTAKSLGQALMSHGFRRTITKIGDYVRLMLFALMFDVLGSLLPFYSLPFATMLCTVAVIYIESKSVIENSRRKKAHAAEIPEIVDKIVHAVTTEEGHKILDEIARLTALNNKHKKDETYYQNNNPLCGYPRRESSDSEGY